MNNKDYISDTALNLSKLDKDLRIDEFQEDEGLNKSVNTIVTVKIVKFFGISILIFGIFLVGISLISGPGTSTCYRCGQNKNKIKQKKPNLIKSLMTSCFITNKVHISCLEI